MATADSSPRRVEISAHAVSGEPVTLSFRPAREGGLVMTGLGLHGGRGGLILKPAEVADLLTLINQRLGQE